MNRLKNLHKIIFAAGFVAAAMLSLFVILPGHFAAVNSQGGWKTVADQAVIFAAASPALNKQSNYPTVEYDTDRPGADYSDFDLPQADFELCRKACADDANCRAYTYVKPSVQGSSARCWLKSSIPTGGQSSCCISGIRIKKSKDSSSETDLSGTWRAVVNSSEGRWDYTMTLQRQSAGKWTGTLTVTLDGKSPSTTEAAVESAGGGRITMIWRPGKPNAQSFEGTATKDRINIAGYGGQITFTRR